MTVVHLLEPAADGAQPYGKERAVLGLARAQREAGIDARIATFAASPLAAFARDEGIPYDACANGGLSGVVDRAGASIVHAHGYKANIVARGLRVRRPAVTLVATCHGFVDTNARLRLYNALDRTSAFLSDAVTVTAPAMAERFAPFVHPIYVANAIADAPPVDAARRHAARARFGFADDAIVVGAIGRLSAEKGVATFAAAADRLPTLRFVVAGAGPEEAALRATRLELLGFRDPADDLLAALDVYVQPSYTEGLSLALLEAMRAGLPIVATRVGATDRAVSDEHDALLVPAHDDAALAAAIHRLATDGDAAKRLGTAARARFTEAFRLDEQAARFTTIYEAARTRRRRGEHSRIVGGR
jgi:glycosyltransferase involved in cell wall biosynthesis